MTRSLMVCLVALTLSAAAQQQSVVGEWNATLKVGASTLHWILHIVQEKGSLSATLDSPDQGVRDVVVAPIEFKDGRLVFDIYVIGGTYDGLLSEDGTTIKGGWRQGEDMLPLTFTRAAARGDRR